MNTERTPELFYNELAARFSSLLESEGLMGEDVMISSRSLTPEEAIGTTKRRDYPIITGTEFRGTLGEICALDINGDSHDRGLFIAALNAVMKHLGLVECTVHCRNDGPEQCAVEAAAYIKKVYGHPKIGLVGYQPSLLSALSVDFPIRVVDLSPVNTGQERCGVMVEDGKVEGVTASICQWADLVLCTGSTICNGSIVDFLHLKDKILFYGTTLAGAAKLMDLPRLCFADRYQ